MIHVDPAQPMTCPRCGKTAPGWRCVIASVEGAGSDYALRCPRCERASSLESVRAAQQTP